MAFQEKQLGQVVGGASTSIYGPASGVTGIIKNIVICNTTAVDRTYSIYMDDDGSVYNKSTALYYRQKIEEHTTIHLNVFYPMDNSDGNMAVEGSGITFTIFGAER